MYNNEDMYKICKVINEIKNQSSINKKIKILEKYSKNELLKNVLYYTYNPFYKYGITKNIIDIEKQNFIEINNIFSLLDILRNNNINNKLRKTTYEFIKKQEIKEIKELYIQIILKDLKIGINIKTINKVFNNLIPTMEIQLSEKYEKYIDYCIDKKITITQKLDGHRFVLIKNKGKINCYSRSGKEIVGCFEIINNAEHLEDNFVYDGEILPINANIGTEYQEVSKILKTKKEKTGLCFYIFDIIPLKDFLNKQSTLAYNERKLLLKNIKNNNFIKTIDILYEGIYNKEKVKVLLEEITNKGFEGLMLNIDDSLYSFKRTKNLLKIKNFDTIDCIVKGIEKGTGKYKNTLGNIIIEFEHLGNFYQCKCGSGFTDKQREFFLNKPNEILNKKVEIQFFEITKNEKGLYGLRFPIFKRVLTII